MQTLQFLIDELSQGRNFHISILDLSGILDTSVTKIKFKNIVHLKNFCNKAKSTSRGYRVCQHCKMLANEKAVHGKEPFAGYCLYGLYEVASPVMIGDSVVAVVYVGNAVINEEEAVFRIHEACKYTRVNPDKLCEELKKCEHIDSSQELFQIAELVSDYLVWLYSRAPKQKEKQKMHWLVSLMKHHVDEMYRTEITLGELAETYQRNEKYMGRLLLREIGMSFNEYKQTRRLELAESLILQSDERIIDIALECGYNSISYFNRAFQKRYGTSPTAYRMKKRAHTAR